LQNIVLGLVHILNRI